MSSGADFMVPEGSPRANFSIGAGLLVSKLERVPIGNELTLAYGYNDIGTHGFWYSGKTAHTETVGIRKNYALYGPLGLYTWEQIGLSTLSGSGKLQNRFFNSSTVGLAYHVNSRFALTLQGTATKNVTVPWFAAASVGYVISW